MEYRQLYKKHKRAVQYGICAVFLIITGLIYLAGRKNASVSENTDIYSGIWRGYFCYRRTDRGDC